MIRSLAKTVQELKRELLPHLLKDLKLAQCDYSVLWTAKKQYKDSDFPEGVYLASQASENVLITQHQEGVALM